MRAIYETIEDGFQSMPVPIFVLCCAVGYGVMLVAGTIIAAVVPFVVPGMR